MAWSCTRDLPQGGFGKTQTYSVQVSATNLFYGWHNKLWSPKFEKLGELLLRFAVPEFRADV